MKNSNSMGLDTLINEIALNTQKMIYIGPDVKRLGNAKRNSMKFSIHPHWITLQAIPLGSAFLII